MASYSKALADALARSDNGVSINLANQAGLEAVAAFARRMGIVSPLRVDPSLALGGSEVSLLEMTAAFVPFAYGGASALPYGHFGIIDDGAILDWTAPRRAQVLDKQIAGQVRDLLEAVVQRGTGAGAAGVPNAAGKTGTSDGPRDGWFIGMTARHVAGIWIGHADDRPTPGLSGAVAANVWGAIELALPNE